MHGILIMEGLSVCHTDVHAGRQYRVPTLIEYKKIILKVLSSLFGVWEDYHFLHYSLCIYNLHLRLVLVSKIFGKLQ